MSDHEFRKDFCDSDIHGWFGLTYASYFAMPRSVMQSMSAEWQHKFVELMEEALQCVAASADEKLSVFGVALAA